MDGVADIACLFHQFFVHAQAAGGIDDDRVIQLLPGHFDGVAGHCDRVPGRLDGGDHVGGRGLDAELRGVNRHAGPFAYHLQLGDGVGALQVGRDQQGGVTQVFEPVTQLAG